jgi:PKD repeat protein
MSDKQAGESGKSSAGWLKTIAGTAAGLIGGGIMMYLSPLLDKVIKPARPVANFAVMHEGTTVTFHNRSTAVHSGWWDFGDGSPLEPVEVGRDVVTHTYSAPGDYTAKLSLRNLLGEESERSVLVRIDSAKSATPEILSLDAYPVSAGSYAPATFRVVSKVKDAQVCVWDLDDDRPLEVVTEVPGSQDRLVTFPKPGGYVIKLAAVNGNQATEKSEIVNVLESPSGTVTAILSVTDQATRVEKVTTNYLFTETFPPQSREDAVAVSRQTPARPGHVITDVRLQSVKGGTAMSLGEKLEMPIDPAMVDGRGAKNLKLQLAEDRRSLRLTGRLVKDSTSGKRGNPMPNVQVPVLLSQERRTAAHRPAVPVTGTLTMPGSALLMMPPVPSDWVDVKRHMRLELRDGEHAIWQESQMPRNSLVTLQGRRYYLSATQVGDKLRVDLREAREGLSPAAD